MRIARNGTVDRGVDVTPRNAVRMLLSLHRIALVSGAFGTCRGEEDGAGVQVAQAGHWGESASKPGTAQATLMQPGVPQSVTS